MNETIVAAIPSILIAFDLDAKVTVWNPAAAAALGVEANLAIGHDLADVPASWDQSAIQHLVETCLRTKATFKNDALPFTRLGGKAGILGVTADPLFDSSGDLIGVLFCAADKTDRLAAERHLMQAQKLESIGQLAAGIAHEINTPTQYVADNTRYLFQAYKKGEAALAIYKSLLDDESLTDSRLEEGREQWAQMKLDTVLKNVPEAIEESLEGLDRIATIVRAMKEFSHPGSVEKNPTDLNHSIESTVTVARNEWKYVAKVELDLDPKLPAVPCLVGEFNQVILNMLVNAAHAIADRVGDTGEMGLITVSTRKWDEEVLIMIRDTGLGMPPAVRDRIFDPFFTTKEVGKGTGQGLTLAHDVIVHRHGGQIHVESEVGQGTIFSIILPLTAKDEEDLAA